MLETSCPHHIQTLVVLSSFHFPLPVCILLLFLFYRHQHIFSSFASLSPYITGHSDSGRLQIKSIFNVPFFYLLINSMYSIVRRTLLFRWKAPVLNFAKKVKHFVDENGETLFAQKMKLNDRHFIIIFFFILIFCRTRFIFSVVDSLFWLFLHLPPPAAAYPQPHSSGPATWRVSLHWWPHTIRTFRILKHLIRFLSILRLTFRFPVF